MDVIYKSDLAAYRSQDGKQYGLGTQRQHRTLHLCSNLLAYSGHGTLTKNVLRWLTENTMLCKAVLTDRQSTRSMEACPAADTAALLPRAAAAEEGSRPLAKAPPMPPML